MKRTTGRRTTVSKLTTAHTADPASQRSVLEQVVPEALNEPAAQVHVAAFAALALLLGQDVQVLAWAALYDPAMQAEIEHAGVEAGR